MPNGTTQEQPQTLSQEITEASKKAIVGIIADRAAEKVELGETAEDVLSQVANLAGQKVAVPGSSIGILGSLLSGKPAATPRQTQRGEEGAINLLNTIIAAQKERREAIAFPLEQETRTIDALKGLLDFFQKSGNREGFDTVSNLLGTTQQQKKERLEQPFIKDPFTGELTPESLKRKTAIESEARAAGTAKIKREQETVKKTENFNTTASLFKNFISQLKGGIEEGGAGGLLQGFYGNFAKAFKIKGFSRTAAIPGQRRETALALNRILTGQNRVIKGVVQMINETLPTEKDPPGFIANKVEQSLRNAFGIVKAFEKAGMTSDVLNRLSQEQLNTIDVPNLLRAITLTPEEKTQIDTIVNDVLAAPATQPRTLLTPKEDFGQMSEEQLRRISRGEE